MGGLSSTRWKLLKVSAGTMALAVLPVVASSQTIPASSPDAPTGTVYVADFEISAASVAAPKPVATDATRAATSSSGTTSGSANPQAANQPPSPVILTETDTPTVQAHRLADYFRMTLMQTLQKNGFNGKQQDGALPENGVLLRGVFTEADPMNRVRKAVLGGGSTSPKLVLYVGTFNLAHPDQPMFQPASVQAPDARFGPVITLNNYVPMAKYELDKNPTEDEVRKICTQIVEGLKQLLKTNSAAFAQ
jgi:Domain of unknown function (DUF4410)